MNRTTQRMLFAAALGLGTLSGAGCAIDDSGPLTAELADARSMVQPVFVEPVFVVDGLEALPRGLRIEELRLGVGAIFLDLVSEDTGVAYANRDPFRLEFDLTDGVTSATAPIMQLPRGGDYEVSVQLEPQRLLAAGGGVVEVATSASTDDQASLVVSGYVEESIYIPETDDDGTLDEPVPLPWHPTVGSSSELRRELRITPFSYASTRTVRFSIDEVRLMGGSRIHLVMHVDVGGWIQETIRPALDTVLDERRSTAAIPGSTGSEAGENIELEDRVGELGGEDALIGGMDVEVRPR